MGDVAGELVEVRLLSAEGETFTVDKKAIALSSVVTEMMGLGLEESPHVDTSGSFPVENVSGETLLKVIDWCTHHKDNPPELIVPEVEGKTYDIDMSDWDKEFFKMDLSASCDLILAANYLDIKGLFYQCSKHISDTFFCGKTAVEVRENLGLADDLTPEQREQLEKENAWCED